MSVLRKTLKNSSVSTPSAPGVSCPASAYALQQPAYVMHREQRHVLGAAKDQLDAVGNCSAVWRLAWLIASSISTASFSFSVALRRAVDRQPFDRGPSAVNLSSSIAAGRIEVVFQRCQQPAQVKPSMIQPSVGRTSAAHPRAGDRLQLPQVDAAQRRECR